ncbi:Holliday junction branch migration protein RuvA [candidate division KSB1 bacterium]|nr:Holliday junction branch migration protein RuvA [candidate division KSB1 bacterium]
MEKTPTSILLDVNGVGFYLHVSLNCSRNLGEVGHVVKALTYLHVREDILQLYGFFTDAERELFTHLISATGIGPKKALAILSGSTVDDLVSSIANENIEALMVLPGIGKKTAERLVVDLKDKVATSSVERGRGGIRAGTALGRTIVEEAVLALISLGYQQQVAIKSVQAIREAEPDIDLESLIKKALRKV